jgi:uncharacterized damage-inducible protein DinB
MVDAQLLHSYEQGAEKIRSAIAGLLPEQMHMRPVPGAWSIHQIVIHLLDAELILSDRIKRIIAEETPALISFDESKFTANLHYDLWSVEDAIKIIDLHRRNFVKVLRMLPPSTLARKGRHDQMGDMSAANILGRLVAHLDHHLKFVHEKRRMVTQGK